MRTLGAVLALLGASTCTSPPLEAPPPLQLPERGMVVCDQPLAARVGARILALGGNAADAAVATALALAVVHPQAGNLGGGGFALWVPAGGEALVLDFRETAPEGLRVELYLDAAGNPLPERLQRGALSVGVPGSPAGLHALHQRLGSGRFTFAQLVQPAIELAHGGFPVGADLARALEAPATRELLLQDARAAALYYPGGVPLKEREQLVQPELGSTLSRLAREGPRGFYRGPVALAIVRELTRVAIARDLPSAEGSVSLDDLATYKPVWREPLVRWFRGHEVITMPPPSSGGIALLQVLSVLDGFPLQGQRAEEAMQPAAAWPASERSAHWWIEALRLAFAERASVLGDPDFVRVPVGQLLSAEWTARARISIGDRALEEPVPQLVPPRESTTHLSVLDRAGNAVSLTTTLNSSFGAGILVEGCGFLLNNELDDFSLGAGAPNQFALVGGVANAPAPGKRPLSSMTPTVVRAGGRTVSMVLGSRGGPRIITAVVGVLLRTLVLEQPLAEAVAAPRLHQQWSPAVTDLEPGWPEALEAALRERGHQLRAAERWGSVQAIGVSADGRVIGVSDPRSGGAAAGTDEL